MLLVLLGTGDDSGRILGLVVQRKDQLTVDKKNKRSTSLQVTDGILIKDSNTTD